MRRIKTKVKQHAPQSILFRVQTVHVCVVILQFFIVYCIYSSRVKQILSVIAYEVHVFQQNIFTKKKVDKKPHNHRNKCSLAGGVLCTHKVFRCSLVKLGSIFACNFVARTQNVASAYDQRCTVQIKAT